MNQSHFSVALADAQLVAVKRASRKSSASPSLMARISSAAADHLSAAQGILAACPAKRELEDDLLTYVSQDRELAQATVYRWMGCDADKAGKVGESIGCISLSLSILRKLKGSKLDTIASRAKLELVTAEELYRNWTKYNDSVAFEPILDSATVQDRVPSGREVLGVKPFQAPKLKFGDLVDDGDFNERIRGLAIDDQGDESEEETRNYAGKGSYY
jgi:BRO1-like domain